jgi:soluble lytic murein transglycosylase-like protein
MSELEPTSRRPAGLTAGSAVVACLALVTGVVATPASADVMELSSDGSVLVRASDQAPLVTPNAAAEVIGDLGLPVEALTQVTAAAVPAAYSAAVEHLAEAHQISPILLEAVVWQESRWRAGARSPAGALGLAQLMPGTARDLGVDPRDPNANLAGGARYLRQQLDRFGGNVELALAAYNAGPGRVLRAGGIPRITETQSYVRAIVDRLSGPSLLQGTRP